MNTTRRTELSSMICNCLVDVWEGIIRDAGHTFTERDRAELLTTAQSIPIPPEIFEAADTLGVEGVRAELNNAFSPGMRAMLASIAGLGAKPAAPPADPAPSSPTAIWAQHGRRARELAGRATLKGHTGETHFVMLAYGNEFWRLLIDAVSPRPFDWAAADARGEVPIARGWMPRDPDIFAAITKAVPDLGPIVSRPPPPGRFHVLVLGDKTSSVYEISPAEEPS